LENKLKIKRFYPTFLFLAKIEPLYYVIIVQMRSDKGKAFVLRSKGKSYREISAELGVAVSTLSNWFADVDFSKAIKKELTKAANKKNGRHLQSLNRTRGIALEVQYEHAEKEALKELKLYRNLPLFTTALGIYWGEGDRVSKSNIRVSNIDPRMLRVFFVFLTIICGLQEEKISLALYLYEGLDEAKCKRYWRKHVGIKKFHRTQWLPSRHPSKRLPYGTCGIVTTNTYAKRKLLTWIDHLPEMVLNTVPKK
jgi:transcriptional regulator with XRE-family HTH domain